MGVKNRARIEQNRLLIKKTKIFLGIDPVPFSVMYHFIIVDPLPAPEAGMHIVTCQQFSHLLCSCLGKVPGISR